MVKKFYNPDTHDQMASGILPIDIETISDPQYVGEYASANQ